MGAYRIVEFLAIVSFTVYGVNSLRTYAPEINDWKALEEPLIIDGLNINLLNKDELAGFLYAEDEKLQAELDIWVGKQTLSERYKPKNRVKRIAPLAPLAARLAWVAGRALFRSLSKKAPSLSRNAGKLTKQYQKNGDFGTALRDFRSLKPSNIKTFRGPKGLKGVQGTIGNGRWTVKARSTSSGKKSPTLEIHRSSKLDRKVLRKVRYNKSHRKLP